MAEYIDKEKFLKDMIAYFHCVPLITYECCNGINLRRALEEQPAADVVDKEPVEQLKWERDTAIEQLQSYGVGLGEKTDIVKVNHGEWIRHEKDGALFADYECSVCSAYPTGGIRSYYCPNCGAKMERRVKE